MTILAHLSKFWWVKLVPVSYVDCIGTLLTVWSTRSLRSAQAAIDAVLAASQQCDTGELLLEGQIIDNETVKLEAPY